MIGNKLQAPSTRRSFTSPWIELDYLCKKVHYWLYTRRRKVMAERYRDRLARVLNSLPKNDMAILRQDGFALLFHLTGDVDESIIHREREIKLMERLHEDVRTSAYDSETRAYMLRDRDRSVLVDRRSILESLRQARLRERRNLRA